MPLTGEQVPERGTSLRAQFNERRRRRHNARVKARTVHWVTPDKPAASRWPVAVGAIGLLAIAGGLVFRIRRNATRIFGV